MKICRVIGDGSCLIHSILGQICNHYNSLQDHEKSHYARLIRREIANAVSLEIFESLSNGVMKEVISYDDWKSVIDSKLPLGEESLEILQLYFKVNIFIYWQDMKKYPIHLKHYNDHVNVYIYWSGNHYDIIEP